MIRLATVVNNFGGEDVNINYLTAEALVYAGVLDRKKETIVNDNFTLHVYEATRTITW